MLRMAGFILCICVSVCVCVCLSANKISQKILVEAFPLTQGGNDVNCN